MVPMAWGPHLPRRSMTRSVRLKNPEEIERSILNGVPGTLMAGWRKSLSDQEVADLMQLIARWEEVPGGALAVPEQVIVVTEEQLSQGAALYAANCSSCHAPEGQGSQRATALNVKAFLETTPDQAIKQIVTLGVPETTMPAWGDRMSETQIEALVGFIRSWEPEAPEVASPIRMRGPWSSGSGGAPALPSGGVSPGGGGKGAGGYQGGRNRNNAAVQAEDEPAAAPEALGQAAPEGSLNTQSASRSIDPENNRNTSGDLPVGDAPSSEGVGSDAGFIKVLSWWAEIEGLERSRSLE